MEALAERALAYPRAQPVHSAGPLCGVTDWATSSNSTTVKVRDTPRKTFLGRGLCGHQIHKVLSRRLRSLVEHRFVPPASMIASIRRCTSPPGSWPAGRPRLCPSGSGCGPANPTLRISSSASKTTGIRRWTISLTGRSPRRSCRRPTSIPARGETLRLDGRVIDADVHVGQRTPALALRLVGVQMPKGYCFFLTNLPPTSAHGRSPTCTACAGRWNSARSWTSRYTASTRSTPNAPLLQALLHASLIASILAALLAHTHNLNARPQQDDQSHIQRPPCIPGALALQLAVSCQSIAQAFDLQGEEATRRWDKIAALLTHGGRDPHWRRRPSVLISSAAGNVSPFRAKKATAVPSFTVI